jgi:predicted metal-binding protein
MNGEIQIKRYYKYMKSWFSHEVKARPNMYILTDCMTTCEAEPAVAVTWIEKQISYLFYNMDVDDLAIKEVWIYFCWF